MAKIPIILESGRADCKLATSNSIFDENKGMFQSEINDIQNTLNSDNPNKPLSAKQGKVLKELLDSKVIEIGSIPIDSEPILGNTTHIVNSDGLAKEFNKCNTTIINTDRIANEAIVPSKLSTDIQSLISNLSKTATYAGIATPTTNPGTPEGPVFYIAKGKGTYTNFGGIDVAEDEVVILYYDTVWHKEATGIASNDKLAELEEKMSQNPLLLNSGLSHYIVGLKTNFRYKSITLNQVTINQSGKYIVLMVDYTDSTQEQFAFTSSNFNIGYETLEIEKNENTIQLVVLYDGKTINESGLSIPLNETAIIIDAKESEETFKSVTFDGEGFLNDNGSVTQSEQYRHNIEYVKINYIKEINITLYHGSYIVLYNNNHDVVSSFTSDSSSEVITLQTFLSHAQSFNDATYVRFSVNASITNQKVLYSDMYDPEQDIELLKESVSGLDNKISVLEENIAGKEFSFPVNAGVYTYVSDIVTNVQPMTQKTNFKKDTVITLVIAQHPADVQYNNIKLYKEDGTYVQLWSRTSNINLVKITIPEDGVYLQISNTGSNTFRLILSESLDNKIDNCVKKGYAQRVINCLGDSITYGVGDTSGAGGWVSLLSNYTGGTVKNCGIGGSTIGGLTGASGSAGYFPMWGRISADTSEWVNGSGTPTSTYADRVLDENASMTIIFGGVNDFGQGVPMGTLLSEDCSTFKGAYNVMLKRLIERMPNTKIAVILPMKCKGRSEATIAYNTLNPNSKELYEKDYVDAIIEICNYYSIPYLDLYNASGISPFFGSQETNFFVDGLHPNHEGYERLAKRIGEWINSL